MHLVFYKRFRDSKEVDVEMIANWYFNAGKLSFDTSEDDDYYSLQKKEGVIYELGRGSTARAFVVQGKHYNSKYNGRVLKQFFPSTNGKPFLNEECRYIADVSGKDKFRKNLMKFVQSYDQAIAVKESYKSINGTQVLEAELFFTSIGLCYITPYVGGMLLKNYVQDNDININDSLIIMQETLKDILKHSRVGLLHGDIKPSNLWKLDLNGTKKLEGCSIRSLDFGSCFNIDDWTEEIKKLLQEQNVISTHLGEIILENIISSLFESSIESTQKYYSHETIKFLIGELIKALVDRNDEKVECIKRHFLFLDIVAIIKFVVIDVWKITWPNDIKPNTQGIIESNILHQQKTETEEKIMMLHMQKCDFSSYHKAYMLVLLFNWCISIETTINEEIPNKKIEKIVWSKKEVCNLLVLDKVIEELLTVFDPQFGESSYIDNHCNLREYNFLLSNNGLTSVEDIIDYVVDKFDEIPPPGDIISELYYK